jgi:hypothetical protein
MATFSKIAVLSAVSGVLMVVGASAATVKVSAQGSNAFLDTTGQNGWYQMASYSLNGAARTAAAGVFRLKSTTTGNAVTKFLAFCLEPLETLRLPKLYDEGSSLSYLTRSRLGALVDNALSLVRDSKSAAAFQLAAWEIANEGRGSLDLKTGAFQLTSANSSTQGLSQSWLDKIANGTWGLNAQVMILQAPGTQDLVTDLDPSPVPVPAAGGMMLFGLAGLLGLRRKRHA